MKRKLLTASVALCVTLPSMAETVQSAADMQEEYDRLSMSDHLGSVPEAVSTVLDKGQWETLFSVPNSGSMSCANFDPMYSVENSFKAVKGRVRQTLRAIPPAVKASLNPSSLAAAGMQRGSPQMYEMMMNGIGIGFNSYNQARSICERIQGKILDSVPEAEYKKMAQRTEIAGLNEQMKNGRDFDIVEIFSSSTRDSVEGDSGIDTPDGQRGGSGAPRFLVNTTAQYGFDKLANVTDDEEPVMPVNMAVPRTMKDYFPTGKDVTKYVDSIIGTIAIATCDGCKTREVNPGLGINPLIAETGLDYFEKIHELTQKDLNNIKQADLNELSVYPIAVVTWSVIKAIKQTPLQQRQTDMTLLAYDLATAEHIQKMEYAKQALVVGKSIPEFVGNGAVAKDVDSQVALLDMQLDQLFRMSKAKDNFGSSASERILKKEQIKRKYTDIKRPNAG